MTDQQFTTVCTSMLHDIRKDTPKLTGNLANNATLIRSVGANEMRIYVDEKIAPYFPYVNNRVSYRVKGKFGSYSKLNRNYEYFQKAVETAIENLARKIDGEIVK